MPKEPEAKPVEARHQTQHKLETMARYWPTWCRILAQAGRYPFCNRHLWLIDAMAGGGLHESAGDPEHAVPGTPLQAVLAARAAQAEFPGIGVHVRAIDVNRATAATLEKLLSKYRRDGVDVEVHAKDWAAVVPAIAAEIARADHPLPPGARSHDHRSLWLLDPYGVEPLDRALIERLPPGSEVIVNFDENGVRRHAGKDLAILKKIYGDDRWKQGAGGPTGTYAQIFADSFASRYPERTVHALRPTGSQDRFMVHLTGSKKAVGPFARSIRAGLKAGTTIAGGLLTAPQKNAAATSLLDRFKGQTLTAAEMYATGVSFTMAQLKAICQAANDRELGTWDAKKATMAWGSKPPSPEPPLTLGLGL